MEEIKKQYFDLVNLLNSSNKIKNEKTSIKFYLDKESTSLVATVNGYSKLTLCTLGSNKTRWFASKNTKYYELEKYLAKCININTKTEPELLTKYLLSCIFKLPDKS